ncbi:MAG: helix-turn-helix transcriptional regulator, partial [Deltaproteobacteria bacterium]|nr:helix-turn-helix transcriptional regulator [Deltaproteobacteria bacterium]
MTTALHVTVNPALLVWACDRAGIAVDEMAQRLKAFSAWLNGARTPTLKQLEAFARTTHVPMGYFFLPEPPVESVPIPDFRTLGSRTLARPSGNLLDVIYACQRRQDWYR